MSWLPLARLSAQIFPVPREHLGNDGKAPGHRQREAAHKKRIPFMAGSGGLGSFFARKGNLGKFEMQNEHVQEEC
jgi:hypothetical protein